MATNDPTQILQDVEGFIEGVIQQAVTALQGIVQNAGTQAQSALPKLETDAFNFIIDFVPQAYRPAVTAFLQPVVQGAEANVNQTINADIAKGIAFALARLQAVASALGVAQAGTGTASPALASAPSSTAAKPAPGSAGASGT